MGYFCTIVLCFILTTVVHAVNALGKLTPELAALLQAYPDHLDRIEGNDLVWKDGERTPLARIQGEPNVPRDTLLTPLERAMRFNMAPIFQRMYGDCRFGETPRRLRTIPWLPAAPDKLETVRMTIVNGVADRVQTIAEALARLPPEKRRFLSPLGGGYSCRNIALSGMMSLHSYGIAIDINPSHGAYWLWENGRDVDRAAIRARLPREIIDIFEREGFVWGGRWHNYDTFHFEYRPELILAAGGALPPLLVRDEARQLDGSKNLAIHPRF